MFELDLEQLTPEQRGMVELWEAHLDAEFENKDAVASCGTMTEVPYVNHVCFCPEFLNNFVDFVYILVI